LITFIAYIFLAGSFSSKHAKTLAYYPL